MKNKTKVRVGKYIGIVLAIGLFAAVLGSYKVTVVNEPTPGPTVTPPVVSTPTPRPTPAGQAMPADEYIRALNVYRSGHGLPSVLKERQACALATTRLGEVRANFSHDGFYARNGELVKSGAWHENLGKHYKDIDSVMVAWSLSPTHNSNLLAKMRYACIVTDGDYWVLIGWLPY